MKKQSLSLNVQFDYITLRTPNGTFTTGRNGLKATGLLINHFDAFRKAYDKAMSEHAATVKSVMEKFTDEDFIASIWPEWNKVNTINIDAGDTVILTEPIFLKKYPNAGTVTEVKKKYAYVKFPEQPSPIGFDMIYMKKL